MLALFPESSKIGGTPSAFRIVSSLRLIEVSKSIFEFLEPISMCDFILKVKFLIFL